MHPWFFHMALLQWAGELASFAEGSRVPPDYPAYRHDDLRCRTVNLTPDERVNGHAHCRALLLGSAVSLNVVDGRIRLGRWQRILMAEFDGPRPREISVVVMGERRS